VAFDYFPDNKSWSLSVMLALAMHGVLAEVDDTCEPLRECAQNGATQESRAAWCKRWHDAGVRMAGRALADERAGHAFTAARKYFRAATYELIGERQMSGRGPERIERYQRLGDLLRRGATLSGEPVEQVEVPYESTTLPALFVPAPGERPPCLLQFDGFDGHKEMTYLLEKGGLARRGISTLIVDQPGCGGALRLRGLPARHDMEVPASACVDYLVGRDDIDPERIGILGSSWGGHHAPRAAAFEKRLRCCVAWGADWNSNVGETGGEHAFWVLGTDDPLEARRRGARFTLDRVAELIECPLLVVHGEDDEISPLWMAQRLHDSATRSPRRELRIYTRDTGGSEHCHVDNIDIALDDIFDWVAETLSAAHD
jgi:dienelactone hydrolase